VNGEEGDEEVRTIEGEGEEQDDKDEEESWERR
jgi:hypothetical protein